MNLSSLAKHFSDEAAAWELVEKMRWPNGPVCPHCGDTGHAYFIKPRNGNRTTSTGRVTYRRLWKCKACRKPFSVLIGTIFERSQVPLSKWLLATYLMSASKNGIAAAELRRTLDVTQSTAWFMTHRLREAMKVGSLAPRMIGDIVADETYVGGNPKNWHKDDPRWARVQRGRGNPFTTPVLALIDAETGEARSRVIPNVTGKTLRKAIQENVVLGVSTLHTDKWRGYNAVGQEMAAHHAVDHGAGQYVTEKSNGTNMAENYFAQLKRSLDGTFHHVSVEHLHRYLTEFDFRYSTRKLNDTARMERIMTQTEGRRVTYRRVTAA